MLKEEKRNNTLVYVKNGEVTFLIAGTSLCH